MSNINRDYIVTYSPKNSKVTGSDNIFFYTSDKNTCNLYIKVAEGDETLELEVVIVPPLATTKDDVIGLEARKLDDKLFEVVNLPNDEIGVYRYELVAKVGNKLTTSELLKYTVKPSVLKGDDM